MTNYILPAVIGYFLGSIPFSYMTARLLGHIDIRNHGSGNSGSTNVLRTLGKKAGAIAFVGDFLKGFILMLLLKHFYGLDVALVGCTFGVIGHCYPIFLKFKGGKGVATSAGTIVASFPPAAIFVIITFALVFISTKIVSLSSICAALVFPIAAVLLKTPKSFLFYSIFLALFVIYRHKANVQRLLKGEESKLTTKSVKK